MANNNNEEGSFQYIGLAGRYPLWVKRLDTLFYSTHCEIPSPAGLIRVELGEWASRDDEGYIQTGAGPKSVREGSERT